MNDGSGVDGVGLNRNEATNEEQLFKGEGVYTLSSKRVRLLWGKEGKRSKKEPQPRF